MSSSTSTGAPPLYHRDIKPSNIVLRRSSAPVLVDFGGVCHGWRPEQSGGSTVTGTYGYVPPEQLMGRVSPQSDLYALGATLLYVVTGREPTDFDFDGGRLSVPDEIDLRPSLRRAIDAMLAPAPRDRPRTAKQVRAVLLGAAVEAPSAPSRALVPARRADASRVGGHDAPRWLDLDPAFRIRRTGSAGPLIQIACWVHFSEPTRVYSGERRRVASLVRLALWSRRCRGRASVGFDPRRAARRADGPRDPTSRASGRRRRRRRWRRGGCGSRRPIVRRGGSRGRRPGSATSGSGGRIRGRGPCRRGRCRRRR
jgi:hypothetical protein